MSISMDAANALERVIDGKIAKAAPKRTAAEGTVTRVDVDGTAYVRLDGSDVDTPAARTVAKVKPGQHVSGTVRDGELVIDGNYSAPATDDTTANAAIASAKKAAKSAKSAQDAADEAQKVADATNQHFWHDSNGVHVTEAEGNAETEHNILMNSLGILLRKALYNLVSITASAVAFFDGSGNTAEHITAQFGSDGSKMYVGGALRQKTDAIGSHYYASDGTEVLHVGAQMESGVANTATLDFLGGSQITSNEYGISVEGSGTASQSSETALHETGPTYQADVGANSNGMAWLTTLRTSDSQQTGFDVLGSQHATLVHGALDFDTVPNASTSTDFFATGIQAFANGGRLRYKGLADMKSWLGLNSLFKVVTSEPSTELTLAAGASNTGTVCNFTGTDGYTLAAVVSVQASSKSVAVTNFWKRSETQMGISTHNPSSSQKTFTVSVTALFVKSAFVG